MNFEDDNFTADKDRAKEICHRIIAENLQFKETFFFGRTDLARDPELLDLLAKAHLTRVLLGIESLNQASLDEVNKHQSIEDIKRACTACWDHGIRVIASVALGLDSDTPQDICATCAFAKSVGAYQIQPAILTPFPGTPVYDSMVEEGRLLTDDWSRFDMTNVTFQPKTSPPGSYSSSFGRPATTSTTYQAPCESGASLDQSTACAGSTLPPSRALASLWATGLPTTCPSRPTTSSNTPRGSTQRTPRPHHPRSRSLRSPNIPHVRRTVTPRFSPPSPPVLGGPREPSWERCGGRAVSS